MIRNLLLVALSLMARPGYSESFDEYVESRKSAFLNTNVYTQLSISSFSYDQIDPGRQLPVTKMCYRLNEKCVAVIAYNGTTIIISDDEPSFAGFVDGKLSFNSEFVLARTNSVDLAQMTSSAKDYYWFGDDVETDATMGKCLIGIAACGAGAFFAGSTGAIPAVFGCVYVAFDCREGIKKMNRYMKDHPEKYKGDDEKPTTGGGGGGTDSLEPSLGSNGGSDPTTGGGGTWHCVDTVVSVWGDPNPREETICGSSN